mgnify:CR=1 FL=1
MAEATLNDVSNAIKEDGNKDREQLKGDSIRQFFQLRSSNKFLTSLTQAQLDSNEQMKKQFEQEQEALKRANDQTKLNELNNTIKEDGHKTRKQFHVDFARQFFQVGNTNTLLTNLIQSQVAANDGLINLTQAEVDSNKQMKKQFEQEQEALRRANAKKTLGEPANDNDSRFKRMMIGLVDSYNGVKKLLDNIKKSMPNKATMFTLLFGGLAAAFAFFPKEVKEYLIDPLIDVINVFRDKESTTGLGKVVEKLKKSLEWISDNLGEEAAWIVGIVGGAAALKAAGIPTLGLGSILGIITKFAMAHPLITTAVGVIGGLIALFDFFRDRTIKSETEKSKALLKEYEAAEDNKEREKIARRAAAAQDRISETAIGNVDSIQDPLKEIRRQQDSRLWLMYTDAIKNMYVTEQEAKKAQEAAAEAKRKAEAAEAASLPQARQLGLVAENEEREANEAQRKANKNRNEALLLARQQAVNAISIAEDSDQLLAAYKKSLEDTIAKFQKAGFEGDRLEEAIATAVEDLNAAVKIRRGQTTFKKIGGNEENDFNSPAIELDRIRAAADNFGSQNMLIAALEKGNKDGTFIAAPRTTNDNRDMSVKETISIYNNYDNWMSKNPNMHYGTTLMF